MTSRTKILLRITVTLLLSCTACLWSACSDSNQEILPTWQTVAIEAGWNDTETGTRTTIGSDNKTNCWVVGDKVSVFTTTSGANREFTVRSITNNGANCTLSGSIQTGETITAAVYPYNSNSTYDSSNGSITATIPSTQTPTVGSFDPKAAVAVAAYNETNKSFSFVNATSALSFEIPSSITDIDYVVLCGRSGETLSGDCSIAIANGAPTMSADGHNNILLKGSASFAPGIYYILLPPTKFVQGLALAFVKSDGSYAQLKSPRTLDLKYDAHGNVTHHNLQLTNLNLANKFKTLTAGNANRKWAPEDLSLGATGNTHPGYFAWGETVEKMNFIQNNYRNWSNTTLNNSSYMLSSTEDAATTILGPYWRMPTIAELTTDAIKLSSNFNPNNGYYLAEQIITKDGSYYWTREIDGYSGNEPYGTAFYWYSNDNYGKETKNEYKKLGHLGLRILPICIK